MNKEEKKAFLLKFVRYCYLDHDIKLMKEVLGGDIELNEEDEIDIVDRFLKDEKNIIVFGSEGYPTKHRKGCLIPERKIIIHDKIRNEFTLYLPDAANQGWNDIYYCFICGVKLKEETP